MIHYYTCDECGHDGKDGVPDAFHPDANDGDCGGVGDRGVATAARRITGNGKAGTVLTLVHSTGCSLP